MKNKWIRLICFGICILLILVFLGDLFHYDKAHMRTRLCTYRECEKDTVDAVYIGTSGVHCFWVTGQAFQEYGQTVYPTTINGMVPWQVLSMIEYDRKYQDPELYIIDMRPFVLADDTSHFEAYSRYFNELLPPFSFMRLKTTNRALDFVSRYGEDTDRFDLSYYLPIFRYHDRWEEGISFKVLKDSYSSYYGYLVSKEIGNVKELPESVFTDESQPIEDFAEESLNDVLDYAEKNGLELLFVNSPHYVNEEIARKTNSLMKLLDEKGIPYFDCCTEEGEEKYPFDKANDFYDRSHTNYYGATKYTSYLSAYLDEHYDLPDRRNDPGCSDWLPAYQKTLTAIEKKGAVLNK